MKKILLLFVTMLLIFTGCNSNPKPEQEEPFIEFTADVFEIEYNISIDPLSSDFIKDTNGNVTYEGKVYSGEEGEYELTYTVTSKTDSTNTKEYVKKFIVHEPGMFNENGYPNGYMVYVIDVNEFTEIEDRFTPEKPRTQTDGTLWPISDEEVGIVLTYERVIIMQRGATANGEHSSWVGEYELVEGDLYRITNLHNSDNPDGKSYEAYFYLTSKDNLGRIYYFTEMPDAEYDTSMAHFNYAE